jgi:hypothetical protein
VVDDAATQRTADARLVGTLLIAGALCVPCIETKSQIPRDRIAALLESVERNVRFTTRRGKCTQCGRIVMTYRLGEHRAPWGPPW